MVLTEKQKHELHEAMLEYMMTEPDKYARSISAFSEEAGVDTSAISNKGLLEKKWTAVIRLQKKVLDLEAKVNSLGDTGGISRPGGGRDDSRNIPKGPSRAALSGHRGPVTAVAVHPTYNLAASASEDGSIKLWDYEACQYERTLKGHTGSVTAVIFAPSGGLLASASADMTAKLWDMTSFQCIKTLRGHDHTLSGICFAPSSDFVFTCSRDQSIKCWEVSSGFSTRTFSAHSDWVRSVCISADGAVLASGSSDHTVIVWRTDTAAVLQTLRGHEHVVETVAMGGLHFSALVGAVGSAVVGGENWSATPVEKTETAYLVSGSRDRTVRLWDPLKGQCLAVYSAHENWVRGVLLHSSGKYILSCSDDKSIRIFDIKEGRCLRTIGDAHGHFVTSLAANRNNSVLVTGSVDRNVCVWGCN